LLVAIVVITVALFNWNMLKPTINEKVSEAIGRPFSINGDLTVKWRGPAQTPGWRGWVPWPHVTANDITIANAEWAKPAQMLTVQRADFTIAPFPLITQQVLFREIQLTGVDAHLERVGDGRANWDFTPSKKEGEGNDTPSAWTVDVDQFEFDRGHVTFRDEILHTDVKIAIDSLGQPIPFIDVMQAKRATGHTKSELSSDEMHRAYGTDEYYFGWKIEGQYEKLPVRGEGKTGNVLVLNDPDKPFPVQVDLEVGRTRVSVAGTLTDPMHLAALDLQLTLSGVSMADLFPITGVTLPDTPRYETNGHLTAKLGEPTGPVYQYRDFNGKVGDSDLHGNLTYTESDPRPKLSGDLNSRQLRMVDLGPLIGVQPDAGRNERTEEARQGAHDKVLPTQAFRTNRWRDMDADVIFSAEHIIYDEKLPISNLNVHLVMNDGLLQLNPLFFGVVGGTIAGDITLNGRSREMTGAANLKVRGLLLKELFPNVEQMKRALGQLNGDIKLSGTGNAIASLLATANGDMSLIVNQGVISKELMEIAGLNVGNYVVSKLFGDEEVKINCGVADLHMKNGIMTPRVFVIDTDNAIVHITGDVNFKDETLDLNVSPDSKGFRLFSLRSPLYIKGDFAHPDVGVEILPLAARGASAVALGVLLTPVASLLALVAPSADEPETSCGSLIKQAKEAR